MTEAQLRKKYIDCAKSYLGAVRGDDRHKKIVDAYNSVLPHPRNHMLTYTDNWCAAFISGIAILCSTPDISMTDIFPHECSCGEQIKTWQSWGRWIEDDQHRPAIGELLYYRWTDSKDFAKTDQKGAANHVGVITWVSGNTFLVLEGNKGNGSVCGYREMTVNGCYIRGYASPNYAALAKAETCTVNLPVLRQGARDAEGKFGAVSALQALLNLYGAKLTEDGSFGPLTTAAVEDFQRRHGLTPDRSVGPATWTALIG